MVQRRVAVAVRHVGAHALFEELGGDGGVGEVGRIEEGGAAVRVEGVRIGATREHGDDVLDVALGRRGERATEVGFCAQSATNFGWAEALRIASFVDIERPPESGTRSVPSPVAPIRPSTWSSMDGERRIGSRSPHTA